MTETAATSVPPHVARMMDEYLELSGRIEKLLAFTRDDAKMNALAPIEQNALIAQRMAMENYADILRGRVDRATGGADGFTLERQPNGAYIAPKD